MTLETYFNRDFLKCIYFKELSTSKMHHRDIEFQMGDANPEQGAEVFEQARIACYSSLGGTLEAIDCKLLILFTFNPVTPATQNLHKINSLRCLWQQCSGSFFVSKTRLCAKCARFYLSKLTYFVIFDPRENLVLHWFRSETIQWEIHLSEKMIEQHL